MIILLLLLTFVVGFMVGRRMRYRVKNYGVTRKMFLTLEIGEIDRKIDIALDIEDYELAFYLKRKMDRLEIKLNKIKHKEKNNESNISE